MRPRSGVSAATILGEFIVSSPMPFFQKNARSCRFFTGLCSLKKRETTTQKPPKQERSFRCFSLPSLQIRASHPPKLVMKPLYAWNIGCGSTWFDTSIMVKVDSYTAPEGTQCGEVGSISRLRRSLSHRERYYSHSLYTRKIQSCDTGRRREKRQKH